MVHGFGPAVYRTVEGTQDVISSPVSGERFFTAIYQIRTDQGFGFGQFDMDHFYAYFTSSATNTNLLPPHNNFKVINWIYGP